MINTQTQIDSLIDLAVIQRKELKQLVESLPQLRDHLSSEIERNLEEIEPSIRAELEQFVAARALDAQAKTSAELGAKIEAMARNLESTTAARYSVIMAERAENANLLAKAEARIAEAASALPAAVKTVVAEELSRFPRAGEIDQLRKEFAEPRGLNPRGRWEAGATYYKLDLVAYNGDSYVANEETKDRPSRASTKWTLNAARGNAGGGSFVNPTAGDYTAGMITNVPSGTISATNVQDAINELDTKDVLSIADGSAAAPSLNFSSETTTGLFRASANVLGVSVAGTSRATFTSTGMTVTGTITPTGSVHAANGTAANPSLSFASDQDTGLYRIGANNIGVAVNGAKVLDVGTGGLVVDSIAANATTNLALTAGSGGASLTLGQGVGGIPLFQPGATPTTNYTAEFRYTAGSFQGPLISRSATDYMGAILGSVIGSGRGLSFWKNSAASTTLTEGFRLTDIGNLLIGGTTDITGTGGLKVFGATAATNSTSGAFQVGSNVGLSGNSGGPSYFGGNGAFGPAFTPNAWGTGGQLDVNGTTGGILGVAYNGTAKGYVLAEAGGILVNSHAGGTAKFNTSGSGATTIGNSAGTTVAGGLTVGGIIAQGGATIASNQVAAFKSGVGPQASIYSNAAADMAGTSGFRVESYGSGKYYGLDLSGAGRGVWGNSSDSNAYITTATTGSVYFGTLANNPLTSATAALTHYGFINSTGLTISATTAATNTTSGALQVAGGVGVQGAGYFGNIVTAPQFNSTGLGNNQFDGVIRFSTPTTVGNAGQVWTGGNGTTGGFFNVPTSATFALGVNNVAQLTVSGSASTFAGLVSTAAATTTTAGLRVPHGAAPTSPVNGDIWTTTAGLFVRINGVTVGPLT